MTSNNSYINIYNQMRNDSNKGKKSREVNRYIPIEFYIEWDRLRMILNPKAQLSPAQLRMGKNIPCNWMVE